MTPAPDATEDSAGERSDLDLDALSVFAHGFELDPEQQGDLSDVLDVDVAETFTRYVLTQGGEPALYGYVDTHRVRSLSESLLIALTPDGEVRRIVVLAFDEPPEYQPRPAWYAQFHGLRPGRGLKYGREVDAVTGATLSGRATVDAVERVHRLHEWLDAATAKQTP